MPSRRSAPAQRNRNHAKKPAGHDVCFIHPKGNADFPIGSEGVLVELVQAPVEVRKAFETIAAAEANRWQAGALLFAGRS